MSDERAIKIQVRNLSKVFSEAPGPALELLEQGVGKAEIMERTGLAVGLDNVSFDLQEGEILVVMGLSGSGKSTLLRCVNRLIEPTVGSIRVDGDDITNVGRDQLLRLRREKFGMVFQQFALFPHRTIQGNVEYGLEVQKIPPAERAARARRAIEQVGLAGWESAYPRQLSGGMQQRAGLARALAVDADILLMDEAFSALDPLIRRDMQYELVALQKQLRKTILFISHDLDEAVNIGDRIILMKDGAIVQSGTPEEILTRPATEYVERFVESVDISRVLTAEHACRRAQAVAYAADGPVTALHKMKTENLDAILVVEPDLTLAGMVTAEAAEQAHRDGVERIGRVMDAEVPSCRPDEVLSDLISRLAGLPVPLPVVDEQRKLLGVVSKGGLLEALAQRGKD